MALMYPWATREYVLYKMSIGLLVMYLNLGAKYKKIEAGLPVDKEYDYDDLSEKKKEMKKLGLIDDEVKILEGMYGDINDG